VPDASRPSVAVEVSCTRSTALVRVSGRVDRHARAALREALFSLREEQLTQVDLDLADATVADASALRTIIAGRRLLSRAGTRLVVAAYPHGAGRTALQATETG
jgi:anti-anti-sigma factor